MPIDVILTCLLIFFARICDVTLLSIRTVLITKGMSRVAAACGFVEVFIYMVILGKVVDKMDSIIYLLSYCAGFSAGTYIGTIVEKRLAFGDAQMRIILPIENKEVLTDLRDMGYGVTSFEGEGRSGKRLMLLINLKRKKINSVYDYLKEKEIPAFVSTNDITSYKGGYQGIHTNEGHFIQAQDTKK